MRPTRDSNPPAVSTILARASERRRRKRVGVLLSSVLLVGAGAVGNQVFLDSSNGQGGERDVVAPSRCIVVNEGVPYFEETGNRFGVAGSGDRVTISGDGFYTDSVSGVISIGPDAHDIATGGEPTVLATFDVVDECHFRVDVEIPDVPDGQHELVVTLQTRGGIKSLVSGLQLDVTDR